MTSDLKLDVDQSLEDASEAAEFAALGGGDRLAVGRYVDLATRFEQARSADDIVARRMRLESLAEPQRR